MSTNELSKQQLAGFWRRLMAFILDAALYYSLIFPALWLIFDGKLTDSYTALIVVFLFSYVVPLVLLVIFWRRWQATPGKLMMECRVVDAQNLDTLSPKQSVIRALGYIISALPYYLGFVWIAFDKRKQGLHDKLAGSMVVRIRDDDSQVTIDQWLERFEHEFSR